MSGQAERLRSGEELRTSWTARLGRTQDTARIERLYFAEPCSAPRQPRGAAPAAKRSRGNYNWVYRNIDSVLLPTDGYTLSTQLGGGQARGRRAAPSPTGQDSGPFARVPTAALPATRRSASAWYATARLEAGEVLRESDVGMPDTLLFRAGGEDSVRGYAYRTLGPIGRRRGHQRAHAVHRQRRAGAADVAEDPSLWWAVFVDAGNAANSWSEMDPALGYGVGPALAQPGRPAARRPGLR